MKRTFAELNEAWNTVEGKPDIYTIHLTEEEVEQSESWITELQELYNEAADIHAQHMNEQIQIEKKQREEINRHEAIRMEQERFQGLWSKWKVKQIQTVGYSNTFVVYDNTFLFHTCETNHIFTGVKVRTE